jgi:dihydroxy-acid dehydratase
MGIPLNMDDFDAISKRTPFICDLTPAGKYVASDYQAAGGSRLLAKRLIDAGHAMGDSLTISGKRWPKKRRSPKRRRVKS